MPVTVPGVLSAECSVPSAEFASGGNRMSAKAARFGEACWNGRRRGRLGRRGMICFGAVGFRARLHVHDSAYATKKKL